MSTKKLQHPVISFEIYCHTAVLYLKNILLGSIEMAVSPDGIPVCTPEVREFFSGIFLLNNFPISILPAPLSPGSEACDGGPDGQTDLPES